MAKATGKRLKAVATVAATLEPDEREKSAIEHATRRVAERSPAFSVKSRPKGDVLQIAPSHADLEGFAMRRLDAFGTASEDFADQAIGRLGSIMRRRGESLPPQVAFNAALAAVDGMRPKDEVEAMLAIQMVATYETAMEMLTRAKQAEYMPQLQECGSLAVKLMRTYAAQVEALARLRRGGEQRVIVQHVTVNEGGQAVVGNVSARGRDEK